MGEVPRPGVGHTYGCRLWKGRFRQTRRQTDGRQTADVGRRGPDVGRGKFSTFRGKPPHFQGQYGLFLGGKCLTRDLIHSRSNSQSVSRRRRPPPQPAPCTRRTAPRPLPRSRHEEHRARRDQRDQHTHLLPLSTHGRCDGAGDLRAQSRARLAHARPRSLASLASLLTLAAPRCARVSRGSHLSHALHTSCTPYLSDGMRSSCVAAAAGCWLLARALLADQQRATDGQCQRCG